MAAFESALRRRRHWVAPIVGFLVLGCVALALSHAADQISAGAVLAALAATPTEQVVLAIVFTALSFASLIFYDLSALTHIGRLLPLQDVARTSFTAYAVGNTAGFGALSGGAVRYRAYRAAGLEPNEIARVVAFVAAAFGIGLAAVTSAALLVTPGDIGASIGLDPAHLRAAAALLLAGFLFALVAAEAGWTIGLGSFVLHLPRAGLLLRQFAVTAADIAASATALYVLLPDGGIGWAEFFALYAIATGLGVISHVPAGLGVFETVIIAGLGPGIDVAAVLGALLVYRLVYHVLPLGLAVLLLASTEIRRLAGHVSPARRIATPEGLAAGSLAAATLGLGIACLVSAPGEPRPGASGGWSVLASAASGLSALVGCVLAVSSRGLMQRLDGAWIVASAGCLGGVALAVAVGAPGPGAAAQAALLLLLWMQRGVFTGPSVLVRRAGTGPWLGGVLLLLASIGLAIVLIALTAAVEPTAWWHEWVLEAPDGVQMALAASLLVAGATLAGLLRPAADRLAPPSPDALDLALKIVDAQGLAYAHLVRMGDKTILFSEDRSAFIMYARQGRSWIALFDPIGPMGAWAGLVSTFIDTARRAGCRAVFYQVSPAMLPFCADAGLRALKLGEQAVMDLSRFDLKGGKWMSLRRAINRAVRDGLTFELVPAEEVPALMEELKSVSDQWLAHHNVGEKSFSLGSFEPAYVAAQPLALVRLEGRIVAFATVLATAERKDAFVDLMRFVPGVHRGLMDLLFVKTMEHLKADGFLTLNLGMAPLAGMADRAAAPLWNRIGGMVFEFGEKFYNFKGLLAFKAKFDPEWQPRYLAVAGGFNPYLAVMDVAILIGGGVRGVFRK